MGRIFGIILLVAAVVWGVVWYVHRSKIRAMGSGEVYVREQPGSAAKPLPPEVAPATPPVQTLAAAAPSETHPPASAKPPAQTISAPATDTISRNPPNGMLFAGAGRYQLYRQGDITWRLDTDTGWACVLLATDAQWSRTRVFRNGCRSSADTGSARGN